MFPAASSQFARIAMSGATSRPDTQWSSVDLDAQVEANGTVSFRVGGIVLRREALLLRRQTMLH